MKNTNNIEELFKNTFENSTEKVPDNIWDKIENELESGLGNGLSGKTVKNTKLLRIILPIVILLVAIPSFFFLSGNFAGETPKIAENINETPKYNTADNNNEIKTETKSDVKVTDNNNVFFENIQEKKTVKISDKTGNSLKIIKIETSSKNEVKSFKSDSSSTENVINTSEETVNYSASFIVSENKGCVPFEVSFSNTSENLDTYHWDFGNGEISTDKNPKVVYDAEGKYTVKLIANAGEKSFTSGTEIIVNEAPVADFNIKQGNEVSAEELVNFTDFSENAKVYKWNFGDNDFSREKEPTHKYTGRGVYNIKLEVWSETGCKDSVVLYDFVVKSSKYKISKPTAFSPNLTGAGNEYIDYNNYNNDLFYLKFQTEVENFRLRIQDKQGIIVYDSQNSRKGWNGYYNNRLMPEGVYVWECSGNYIDGKQFYDFGSVTLLHLK